MNAWAGLEIARPDKCFCNSVLFSDCCRIRKEAVNTRTMAHRDFITAVFTNPDVDGGTMRL
jgi:hypothetical protein